MADRPILFSGPMVRALLDGRKTMTRRVIKPQPKIATHHEPVSVEKRGERGWVWMVHTDRPSYQFAISDWKAPYAAGDRLWVRETWNVADAYLEPEKRKTALEIMNYAATPWGVPGRWRSPIFMPRWASRLTLIVTDVRVQRLQDISPYDALAEGVCLDEQDEGPPDAREVEAFRALWDSINAARGFGWHANPWVVAATFTVHKQNIDQMAEDA